MPEPGGTGDQHHAVRLLDVAPELDQIGIREADHVERKLGELLAHRLFVQHAQHGVFAVNGGHDGDAEIDQAALVAHAETAVLRDAALGDIQLAHHLDARNDGGVPVLRDRRHGVMQHAVNAVLDGHFLIARLDVNVAGAPLERVEDGGVHQLDHRRDVAVGGQLVDGERFVLVLFLADHHVQREAFGDFFEHALGLLGFLEQVGDLRERGDLDVQLLLQQDRQLVDQVEVAGIGERDVQVPVLRLDGHEVVAEHQVDRDGVEQVVIDADFAQVDKIAAVARGQRLGLRDLVGRLDNLESVSSGHGNLVRIQNSRIQNSEYEESCHSAEVDSGFCILYSCILHRNVSAKEKIGR